MNLLFNLIRSVTPSRLPRRRDLERQRRATRSELRGAAAVLQANPDEGWRACVEKNLYGANTLDYTVQPRTEEQAPHGRCERT